ncbi:MAG: glycosyltransferase family 9 protein [Chloroflexi bacterium]|nr:glycosyltransferase family 9 protein [Chloroflexota bacterium]
MVELGRILVVKLADLGDLLTATPALRALRTRFASAEITALVTPHTAALLDGNDAVNHVITFPKGLFDSPQSWLSPVSGAHALQLASRLAVQLRRGHFDGAVLLHHFTTRWGSAKYRALIGAAHVPVRAGLDGGGARFLTHRAPDRGFGARHEADYWLDVVATLGARHADAVPSMELHLAASEIAGAALRWSQLRASPQNVAVLHPGSGTFSVARRWPADRFAAVGDSLASQGLLVAIVAGPGEDDVAASVRSAMRSPSIFLHGISSPRDLAAVLKGCRLFVGNDSGVMHVAATVGVPVVAVFGLSNHRAWGPYPPLRHRVLRLDLPCSPCMYVGHGLGTPRGCPPRTCLEELSPDLVTRATSDLLALSVPHATSVGGSNDGA